MLLRGLVQPLLCIEGGLALKLLKVGVIYMIPNSRWASPIHVILKKGGMTIIKIEKGVMIPTRATTRWRVCIDYCKLN